MSHIDYIAMTDIKRVGDSGIYTTEGNLAGGRAAKLTKEREKQRLEYEEQKNKLKAQNEGDFARIDNKFSSASDTAEQDFRRRTVGLVTAEEFRKAREEGQKLQQLSAEAAQQDKEKREAEVEKNRKDERERKRRKIASTLSFGEDEEEEEEVTIRSRPVIKKSMKDPSVDTSFLPDAEREREMALKKEQLKQEWLEQQEVIKNEVRYCLHFPCLMDCLLSQLFYVEARGRL